MFVSWCVLYPYIYFFVKGLWWFLIHFLWSFVLDSKIYWLRWSWNGIGLTCWFWALKFVTLISSFFKLKKVLSNPSPTCMSDEMTNKFDWSVNQENVQTCAGYCSTNPLLKYLLRWIGNKNYVAEDWNGLSLILTRNGICQTFDTNKKSKTKTRKGDICRKISESINCYLSCLSNHPIIFYEII